MSDSKLPQVLSVDPPAKPAPHYCLFFGRWRFGDWYRSAPSIEWTQVNLAMPERGSLEELALHVLRVPGVCAVRIDECDEKGQETEPMSRRSAR